MQDAAIRRSDRAANIAERAWRQVDADDLDGSWDRIEPLVLSATGSAVRANAAATGRFTNALAASDGLSGDVLVPDAFVGVDGSGRSLGGLLRGSVTTTKQAIAAGMSITEALLTGGTYLTLMLKTAVADVERSASMAAASGKQYTRYVRLVNAGACSRCAILAGSDRFRSNFQRHPACRCSTVPVSGGIPDGLFDTPTDYFESLSPSEQERVFTKAGAEAIRTGADPIKVVNARRGANRKRMDGAVTYGPSRIQRSLIGRKPDGTPIYGYVTVEGKSRRGTYGRKQEDLGVQMVRNGRDRYRSAVRPRLMPESIIDLTDDVDMRRVLLRDAGYLEPPIRNLSNNDWIAERASLAARDRAKADAFYRSVGVFVG
ncbi:hypothetical protein AB0300_18350 [Microbacterium sp. NPDC078814]|uniref:hypothetical protein n=1 Tax=Microbacterium sp. NPDC078814 TaxID=3154767 RepID=UPI00345095CE